MPTIDTFDDAPWCALLEPAISVIAQPAYQIGSDAGRMLLDRIGGRDAGDPIRVVLKTELIVRPSSLKGPR